MLKKLNNESCENRAVPISHQINLLMKDSQIVSFFEMNGDRLSVGEALDFLIKQCGLDPQTGVNLISEIYKDKGKL